MSKQREPNDARIAKSGRFASLATTTIAITRVGIICASACVSCAFVLTAAHAGSSSAANNRTDIVSTAAPPPSASQPLESVTVLGRYPPSGSEPESKAKGKQICEAMSQLPIHSATDNMGSGLAALVWALADPAESWRIFLPIPAA